MTETKVCTKCGETKPINEFVKDRSRKSGYKNCCKRCHAIDSVKYYRTEKGKEANRRSHRRYVEKHYNDLVDVFADYINSVDCLGDVQAFNPSEHKGSVRL